MKKVLISIIAMSIIGIGQMNAQEKLTCVNVSKGTAALHAYVNITPNSPAFPFASGIAGGYYLLDGFAVRGNIKVGYSSDKLDKDDISYDTYSEFLLGAGVQKTLVKTKRLNGYVGADLFFGTAIEKEYYDDGSGSQLWDRGNTLEYGLKPVLGIDFYFAPQFYLGLEMGYDILFNNKRAKSSDGTQNKLYTNTIIDIANLTNFGIHLGFCF